MIKRNILNSPRLSELKRKKHKALMNKALLWGLFFVVVLIGIVFLFRWEKINIKNIQISGNRVVETKVIENAVQESLSGEYLWFFPKTNFLIFPRKLVKDRLADEFKSLTNIALKVENPETLEITLSERKPAYTWCGDELTPENFEATDNKCYFMDESGYIFEEAPYFSGEVYFKFFGKVAEDEESSLGTYFLPNSFDKILSFKTLLKGVDLKPTSLFVKNDSHLEFYLSSNNLPPNTPKIIFRENADFEKLIQNLQTALSAEPLQTDFKQKYSSLEYIDLRFGNKVYYKFK